MVSEIKEYAKKRGTNLAQIERELGFAQGYIRKWDTQKPSYDRVLMVAEFLNVPLESLVESNSLSADETELIQNFRDCDKIGKETIISIAELQAKRCKQELKPFA